MERVKVFKNGRKKNSVPLSPSQIINQYDYNRIQIGAHGIIAQDGQYSMKFIVVYNSPIAAGRDFLTAWASLPDSIMAKSVGLTESDISTIKKTTINRLRT